jgi:hypothetical protein
LITLADAVHVPFTGSAQTFCALVKLDELLLEAKTVPALSVTEVPPLTNDVDSLVQILMVMPTLRRNAHEAGHHGQLRWPVH